MQSNLSDELTQGSRAAGKERLDAAVERGIPQVLSPAGVNMTGCGPTRRNREKYAGRSRILKMDEKRSMTHLKPEVEIRLIDCNLEDFEFAESLVNNLDAIFKKAKEIEG